MTFNGLYHVFTNSLSVADGRAAASVIDYQSGKLDHLEKLNKEYQDAIEFLNDDVERMEHAISHLISLIKSVNVCLYRLNNGCFEMYDMDFLSAFTIYEVRGDTLHRIMDKGTSGASPLTIAITPENEQRYAAVMATKSSMWEPFYNNPYPGRSVLSFPMKMQGDIQWIWNFHFDDTDEKTSSLILSNDIIETREIFGIIHAFCLILQRRGMNENEEGLPHANQN